MQDSIKAEQIGEFLAAKGVAHECRLCGAADWLIQEAPGDARFCLPASYGRVVEQVDSLPVAILICSNCANVETFALRAIERWVAERHV